MLPSVQQSAWINCRKQRLAFFWNCNSLKRIFFLKKKGGERVCFKKIYVSIQSTNEKNPKVFTPQEFSGMVGQLNCFKITSNLNLDPKTIIQPPQPNSTLYVYQVKFLTGVEVIIVIDC